MLLIDADTVTGLSSLGLDAARTVIDAWRDDAEEGVGTRPLAQLATSHQNGVSVVVLTSSPLDTEIRGPVGRRSPSPGGYDTIVVDMHPSYSALNQAVFARRPILVPSPLTSLP